MTKKITKKKFKKTKIAAKKVADKAVKSTIKKVAKPKKERSPKSVVQQPHSSVKKPGLVESLRKKLLSLFK